jgi:hypothetical protein
MTLSRSRSAFQNWVPLAKPVQFGHVDTALAKWHPEYVSPRFEMMLERAKRVRPPVAWIPAIYSNQFAAGLHGPGSGR